MEAWFSKIITHGTIQLEQDGLITNSLKEVPGMFGRTKTISIKNVNPILKNDAIKVKMMPYKIKISAASRGVFGSLRSQ